MFNFDPLLAIATNIAVLLMTAFVLQGHILIIVFRVIAPALVFRAVCNLIMIC